MYGPIDFRHSDFRILQTLISQKSEDKVSGWLLDMVRNPLKIQIVIQVCYSVFCIK